MRHRSGYIGGAGVLALVCGSLLAVGTPAGAAVTVNIRPGVIEHLASTTQPPTEAQCLEDFAAPCYEPAQIQTAYDEQPLFARGITGAGQTIVIVDSFGSPTIQADLATFDQHVRAARPAFAADHPAGRGGASVRLDQRRHASAGPERPRSTSSGPTPWPRAPASSWSRRRSRRPRGRPASRRSSRPRTTSSTITSAA